jgi:plasmid stability protein
VADLDPQSCAGTEAAFRARAKQRHRSVEAEARAVLTRALESEPVTIVDLLSTDEGADIAAYRVPEHASWDTTVSAD